MADRVYQIILLRHGESEGNRQGILQGQLDFPLSTIGRQQVQALAQRWSSAERRFDQIISSPLARALETAEILGNTLATPLTIDPIWREREYGSLAGTALPDLKDLSQPAYRSAFSPPAKDAETWFELYLRAGRAVQSLMGREPGAYLVVAHGGILTTALYAILGISPQNEVSGPRFNFRNTGFTTLSYCATLNRWRVLGVDDQSHWNPDASSPRVPTDE